MHPIEEKKHIIRTVWRLWERCNCFDGNLSARSLAAECGINVTVLYRHFDSLDQILFYASLRYLESYIEGLPGQYTPGEHPLHRYMAVAAYFNLCCFEHPYAFKKLFIDASAADYVCNMEDYYELFPDREPLSREHVPLLVEEDLHQKDLLLLQQAADLGAIAPASVKPIAIANTILYKGMLERYLDLADISRKQAMLRQTLQMQLAVLTGFGADPALVVDYSV